ncbi:AAA family ATPase [Amycolatopsis tolypomycina]|uniref:AAA family ATPase n=1 Tax=Amycolatopsis tolypomycina TaxID=208445 RepID=UPI0033BA508E
MAPEIDPKFRAFRFAICGTHYTGKTTLCHEVVSRLLRRGISVAFAAEPSRTSRYLAAGIRGFATQLELFAGTISTEVEAARSSDIVICDRSLLDVLAYTDALGDPGTRYHVNLRDAMTAFADVYMKTYDGVFKTAWRFDMEQSKDSLRVDGAEFQDLIDQRICYHAHRLGITMIHLEEIDTAATVVESHVLRSLQSRRS